MYVATVSTLKLDCSELMSVPNGLKGKQSPLSSVIQQLLVPEGEKSPTEEKKSFASPMTPTYIPSPSNQSPNTSNAGKHGL